MRLTREQRCRARESVRVFVLQSEAQGREERAGYGDTGGVVSGVVDGGGLFECLEYEVETCCGGGGA